MGWAFPSWRLWYALLKGITLNPNLKWRLGRESLRFRQNVHLYKAGYPQSSIQFGFGACLLMPQMDFPDTRAAANLLGMGVKGIGQA